VDTLRGVSTTREPDSDSWYTPPGYIDAALRVMGGIDLDPASCATANTVVGATRYYTKDDNGLEQPWAGRVWLNPPYSQPLIAQFVDRLVDSYQRGEVGEAIALTNNATDTAWAQRLAATADAHCLLAGLRFWHPGKASSSPRQGQTCWYLGPNPERFAEVFAAFGAVSRRSQERDAYGHAGAGGRPPYEPPAIVSREQFPSRGEAIAEMRRRAAQSRIARRDL
jgi:hypothetical protein